MNTIHLKQRILHELDVKTTPDLEFLYSTEVLELAPEILCKLLELEKQRFEEILKIQDKDIVFEIFDEPSKLDTFYSLLSHLNMVHDTKTIRNIIEKFDPKYIDFGNEVAYNKRYYQMLSICSKNGNNDGEQKKILEKSIRNYKIRGINLEKIEQDKLKNISQKLSKLSQDFSNNLLDSQKEFSYLFDDDTDLKELPQDDLDAAKKRAIEAKKEGYLFDSSISSYMIIMKYCSNSDVRKHFFIERGKFATSGKHDNRQICVDILNLKNEKAILLGYKNFAELSLVLKMADSPEEIKNLLLDVNKKALKKATEEIDELKDFFKLKNIELWDMGYYQNLLKEQKYSISSKQLKQYFEFDRVVDGLFSIVKRLYNVELKQLDIESYNSDIKIYEVFQNGTFVSYFMSDYFYRPEKKSGAWCDVLRGKDFVQGETIVPFVVNVCNFQKGEKGKTLLTHMDIQTMFHEFGHGLHCMLSKSKYSSLGGFGVEWDFVELPSQLLENWSREKEGLSTFAEHFETGETISDELMHKMETAKYFGSGNFISKQNEIAYFDMEIHSSNIKNVADLEKTQLETAHSLSPFTRNSDYKMFAGFSHVFAGGYAAGYYSYMWAEIIEKDILSEFKKNGMFDQKTADAFLEKILSAGSVKTGKQMFNDFMGREVDITAFLEENGI